MRATALHSPIGLYWKEIMRGFLQQLFMTVFLDSCGRFALQWLNRLIWMHLNPWTPSTLASASSSFFQAPMFLILKLESRKTQNKTINLPSSACLVDFGDAAPHLQRPTFAHRNWKYSKYFALRQTHPEKKIKKPPGPGWVMYRMSTEAKMSVMYGTTRKNNRFETTRLWTQKTPWGDAKSDRNMPKLYTGNRPAKCLLKKHQNENRSQTIPWKIILLSFIIILIKNTLWYTPSTQIP